MPTLYLVMLTSLLAGLTMAIGAILASFEHIQPNWHKEEFQHSITAFGAGSLLSAVALVLVPEGIALFTPLWASVFFLLGAISFMALDAYLNKINTPASQMAAMLSDFIPESIALGAAFAYETNTAFLLAGLIALQNFPEGFSAYRELVRDSLSRSKRIIIIFALMALLGPIAGVIGFVWLANYPEVISALMLFASGGILYSIFQDIAPQIPIKNRLTPPMGAVLGFLFGMIGLMITT
jgi:ZIP family zinc transporter